MGQTFRPYFKNAVVATLKTEMTDVDTNSTTVHIYLKSATTLSSSLSNHLLHIKFLSNSVG